MFYLMTYIEIETTGDLLNHLSFWSNKTDDECIEMATNECGLDAERALINILERDFCKGIVNSIIDNLCSS